MNYSELKSRCRDAMTCSASEENEEMSSVLCQNDWVRILTVRDSDTIGLWRIEVEVSLPFQKDPVSGKNVKHFVQDLITHLEYLLRLDNEGLTLGVLSRDGLWTASLEIDDLPEDNLFKALIPPYV